MENQNFQPQTEQETELVPLLKLCFSQFVHHWRYFLASVVVCVAIGWFYQQRQPRVYGRQAVMLIDDADNTSGAPKLRSTRRVASNAMLDLGGISAGDNLQNEMFILTSNRLLQRVVDTLGLDVEYTTRRRFHPVSLYKREPLRIDFEGECRLPVALDAKMLDADRVELSEFDGKDIESGRPIVVKYDQTVSTPIGRLTVRRAELPDDLTDEAREEMKDLTVHVVRMPKALAAGVYQQKVAASEYDKESSLIVLSCSDISATRAEDVLNEIFMAYKRDVVENKNRVAQNTEDFVNERISIISAELSGVEEQLVALKQQSGLIDFTSAATSFMQESTKARDASLALETELTVVQYLQDYLARTAGTQELIPALSLSDAALNQQIAAYNKDMTERTRFAANTSEEQNAIRQLDLRLASSRTAIEASLRSLAGTIGLRLRDARANENSLAGKIATAPSKEREGLDIQRQQALKETLYTYLLNKREETAMQLAINEANVRLVEEPLGSANPVSPKRGTILLVSFVLGLLIPAAVIWIRRALDVTVHTRRDVEALTDAPIVGEILHLDTGSKNAAVDFDALDAESPFIESLRIMRHSITFMRPHAKVLMTTSSEPGFGKTFVARSLSVILARAGKKVLLIDADIRKRTLSRGHRMPFGLTTYLSGEGQEENVFDLIRADVIDKGVDFLPAGPVSPNPGELLTSARLETLIAALREQYDFIILDTVPYFSVVDASIINRFVDMTLFVLRAGKQERAFLSEIEKMYKEKSIKDLCLVLNSVKTAHEGYGYGYGYGY